MSTPISRHAVFHLTLREDKVVERDGKAFSVADYSRFKHGEISIEKKWGYALADLFIEQYGTRLEAGESFAVASVAFMHVQNAAANMTDYFNDRLGAYMRAISRSPVEQFRIYKYVSDPATAYKYASTSVEERRKLLDATPFSLDEKRLAGKTLVIIDDVCISGTSERKTYETLENIDAREIVFLYVAIMDPEIARIDPGIESRLNQGKVETLTDILPVIRPGEFHFNTRNSKFVLQAPPQEFAQFLEQADPSFWYELYRIALTNGYYLEPRYTENIDALIKQLTTRNLL